MITELTVRIFSFNCWKNGMKMAVSVDQHRKLILDALDLTSSNQKWAFVLNLVDDSQSGGYSLINLGQQMAAEVPPEGQQIVLNDDPTPFGSAGYFWAVWPCGKGPKRELVWAIQRYDRGPAMNAEKSGCDVGTRVLLWGWVETDNNMWIIEPV